ncbi:hypothetical protein [Kribbella deserti]|uniref:Tachylectin 2 domain-containing protein n=1 Tax=Kribbella deserti TaxID=1926257 RepID=A0ABV6QRL1_9ACTN
MRQKSVLSAASAFALAATGIVFISSPSEAAVGDVPAGCSVYTAAYRSDGQRVSYGYSASKTSVTAYTGDKLAWVPTAHQQLGASGDPDTFNSTELATHPTDGYLYLQQRSGTRTNGVWKMTKNTATRVKAGFGGTTILASGYPYLYRVAGTSLYRHTVTYPNGVLTISAPVKLPGTAWNTVKTLVFERTEGTGTAAVDVLIGTKSNGELKEWRIKQATPTSAYASTVLRSTGWGAFTSLSTGYCQSHPNGRPLLAITATGSASVHFDANKADKSGVDIKGGSLGALGWTARAYGQ